MVSVEFNKFRSNLAFYNVSPGGRSEALRVVVPKRSGLYIVSQTEGMPLYRLLPQDKEAE